MKVEYDPEAEAMYVYFDHPDAEKPGSVKRTRKLGITNLVYTDWGHDGKMIGMEFLGVKNIEVLTEKE